jgi:hypothetical protein
MHLLKYFKIRLGYAVLLTALLLCAIYGIIFLAYLRYLPPGTKPEIDQEKNLLAIKMTTGFTLPKNAKILVASDGQVRDGTKGFFYWIIFSEDSIEIPETKLDRGYRPSLDANVKILENEITPYKIKKPKDVFYKSWRYGETDVRTTIVTGQNGSYISMQTAK